MSHSADELEEFECHADELVRSWITLELAGERETVVDEILTMFATPGLMCPHSAGILIHTLIVAEATHYGSLEEFSEAIMAATRAHYEDET